MYFFKNDQVATFHFFGFKINKVNQASMYKVLTMPSIENYIDLTASYIYFEIIQSSRQKYKFFLNWELLLATYIVVFCITWYPTHEMIEFRSLSFVTSDICYLARLIRHLSG